MAKLVKGDLDVFAYQWSVEEEQESTLIRIYGVTKENKNVYIRVDNFTPYCYVELPTHIEWTESRIELVANRLSTLSRKLYQPVKRDFVMRRKLYYAHKEKRKEKKNKKDEPKGGEIKLPYKDKLFPFLFFAFRSTTALHNFGYAMKKEIDVSGLGRFKFNVHEGEAGISPVLKLLALKKLPAAGWINVKGILIPEENKESSFDIEISCSYEKLTPINDDTIPVPRVLSFDIEANSTITSAMPNAERPNDKIFQIGCTSLIKGVKKKYLFSLGKPDHKKVGLDVDLRCFKTEADLIVSLRDLIRDEEYNVIIGYNILGWDFLYMIGRSKFTKCFSEFDTMGCLNGIHDKEVAPKFESKAYSAQKLVYLDSEGRLFLDLLPIIKRDHKLLNYRLKTVTTHFGLPTKDPLTPQDIFRCFREFTAESLGVCGKYCFVEGTQVSLEHMSVPIESMINNKQVISYDEKERGLILSNQSKFFDNGEHECVELTFEDGTKLTCTPDHRIMTSENKWVEAKDLVLNSDRVKSGISPPACDKSQEQNSDWKIEGFSLSENYDQTLSLCRLLGLLISDGHLREERSFVYVGHKIDVDSVKRDIYNIIGEYPSIQKQKYVYRLEFPNKLHKIIKNIDGLILGDKLNQEAKLPTFLLEENCPLPVIREFLGGLFGGDGHTICLNKSDDKFTPLGFSQSKTIDYIDSLSIMMNTIINMLSKFGIRSILKNKQKNKQGIGYSLGLYVKLADTVKFYQHIGFKHCCHKSTRLSVAASYYKMRINSMKQAEWTHNKTIEFVNEKNISYHKASILSHKLLKENESVINNYYSLPTGENIRKRKDNNFVYDIDNFKTTKGKFPSVIDYLTSTDSLKFFCSEENVTFHNERTYAVDINSTVLPTFNLKIIGRKNIGKKRVYDIEVENTHSFIANGIVVHNCVQDSYITLLLFEKLQIWFGLCEMAKTAHVPIFWLFTKGTQIQMYSQVMEYCMYNNYVIISNGYTPREGEEYQGATVLTPVPGKYKKVLSFDFASLYPSIIMAYNIDYSTLIPEPEMFIIDEFNMKKIGEWRIFPCVIKLSIPDDKIELYDDVEDVEELDEKMKALRKKHPHKIITIQKERSNIPDEDCNCFIFSDHSGCLMEGTLVSVGSYSVPIETLISKNNRIITWDKNQNGLIEGSQSNFFDQGIKECVELTLEDGTSMICTPDHRFLSSDNKWIEADNFIIGKDRIKQGIIPPMRYINQEMNECNGWKLHIGSKIFDTSIEEEYENLLRFARILGYAITDGSVLSNRVSLFVGHEIDVENIQRDIKHLCGRNLKSCRYESSNVWTIGLPLELAELIIVLDGVTIGKRTNKPAELPKFILDEKCPLPVIKEFLVGMFSGDGITCGLNKNNGQLTSVKFSQTRTKKYSDSLNDMLSKIGGLLSKFNISTTISNPVLCKKTGNYETLTNILTKDICTFHDKIGFYYCVHKQQRLTVANSYFKLRNNIQKQTDNFMDIVKQKIENTNRSKSDIIKETYEELKNNPIFNSHYSLPTYDMCIQRLYVKSKKEKITLKHEYFQKPIDYIKSIGALEMFDNNKKGTTYSVLFKSKCLPTFNLKIIHKRNVGYKHVYDIEVKDTHNFIANGFVTHNCNHDDNRKRLKNGNFSTAKRKIICNQNYYRFIKAEVGGKGVVPTLLENLIAKRKATRNEIKENNKIIRNNLIKLLKYHKDVASDFLTRFETDEKEYFENIDSDVEKDNDEWSDDKDYKSLIEQIEYLIIYNEVLDKRQLAIKICANSMYGAMGVKKGYLPLMPGASSVTYKGRKSIEFISTYIPEKHNGITVYGDSVTGDTPLIIKYPNNTIDIKRIDQIGLDWKEHNGFKSSINSKDEIDINRSDKEQSHPFDDIQVWTDGKWSKIHKVIRHRVSKKLYRVTTHTGTIDVTEDHSLISKEGKEVKPTEVKIGDSLLHSFPDEFEEFVFINGEENGDEIKLTCVQCKESKSLDSFYDHNHSKRRFNKQNKCIKCVRENIEYKKNDNEFEIIEYNDVKHLEIDVDEDEAFVWGLFMAEGSCGTYYCDSGNKHTWAINMQDYDVLEKCRKILEEREGHQFKILETMESSSVYKLVPVGCTKYMVTKYRNLFYYGKERTGDNVDGEKSIKIVPYIILNSDKAIRESYFVGYYEGDGEKKGYTLGKNCRFECKGKLGCQGLLYIAKSLGYTNVSINDSLRKPDIFKITGSIGKFRKDPEKIKRIIELESDEYNFVYDIETEEGIFQAGIGSLVVKNTDSAHIYFPRIKDNKDAIELADKITEEMKTYFKKPMALEFEKIYEKYIILTKKRYMARVANKKGEIIDFTKRGVCLSRRDGMKVTRDIYLKTTLSLLDDVDEKTILSDVLDGINDMFQRKYGVRDFVMTKTIGRGSYKAKTLPAHVQLGNRMKERGIEVGSGSRVEYVFTTKCQGEKNFNQGDKVEDLDYFLQWRRYLRIDYLYYMEKQFIKPIDELLKVGLGVENFAKNQFNLRVLKWKVNERIKELAMPKIRIEGEEEEVVVPTRVTKPKTIKQIITKAKKPVVKKKQTKLYKSKEVEIVIEEDSEDDEIEIDIIEDDEEKLNTDLTKESKVEKVEIDEKEMWSIYNQNSNKPKKKVITEYYGTQI